MEAAKLLVSPSLVQAPFMIVKIGGYTFGKVDKQNFLDTTLITFPNFIDSMTVNKINGQVNSYTIKLVYGIAAGDDPNMIDKILSLVSSTRKITIQYGDWSIPSFIYREETAVITDVKSNVDFASSKMFYTITAIGDCLALTANSFNFPARFAKPSDVIKELLNNKQYKLLEVFPGMRKTHRNGVPIIAATDSAVNIPAQQSMNILQYINFLVSCMVNINGGSTYFLSYVEDKEYGLQFRVNDIRRYSGSVISPDTFVVDIGFPTDTYVTQFSLQDDQQWTILYDYAKEESEQTQYSISNTGVVNTVSAPSVTKSKTLLTTTALETAWWKKVTEFPISATLKIKGLLRPAMLMTYLKINSVFYGRKHISSGTYIITKQVDSVDSSGYSTTLSLLRVAGDPSVEVMN